MLTLSNANTIWLDGYSSLLVKPCNETVYSEYFTLFILNHNECSTIR